MAQGQPIIRGIQAVGSVIVKYAYNGKGDSVTLGTMKLPDSIRFAGDHDKVIYTRGINGTDKGIEVAGFRLDSNFLDANPQIASSFMIPILGGGAIALTNNNRSGVLTVASTRVSSPRSKGSSDDSDVGAMLAYDPSAGQLGADQIVWDLSLLAQIQQSQPGGDSVGSTITISFSFAGMYTVLEFQGCTIASVKPLTLSGNDAADYGVTINYLNWVANYSSELGTGVDDA